MENKESDKKRKIVSLTVTEDCNLNCVYCYEKAKSKKVMGIQVAKDAVEFEFNNSDEFDEIEFNLFGGEPTIYKNFIIELVEWTCAKKFKKPFLFFLQTNGTLVHGKFQDWLLKHKNHVYFGLSLDGTPETQDKNRSNSYNKINVDFFVKNSPKQGIRITINSDTVYNLSNDIIHLHNLGFLKIDASFVFGIDWNMDKVKNVLKEELEKLCNFYLENPKLKECSIFDVHLTNFLQKDRKVQKWCGTGTSMVSIAVDGKKYPCHTFQPNINTASKSIKLSAIDFNKIDDFSDPECLHCILEPDCQNCYGMNYITRDDILKRDKQMCNIMKIRVLAISCLRAKQIEKGLRKMETAEIYQTIKAIQWAQSEYSTV